MHIINTGERNLKIIGALSTVSKIKINDFIKKASEKHISKINRQAEEEYKKAQEYVELIEKNMRSINEYEKKVNFYKEKRNEFSRVKGECSQHALEKWNIDLRLVKGWL